MKDTLRKKSGKSDSNNEFDVPSNSSEAPSNPWASETSSAVNGDIISRQVSKASKSPDTNSPQRQPTQEQASSPPPSTSKLEVPSGENGTDGTETSKPTRRRKTITKNPHTFELEADLNPVKKEQAPPPTPEPPKTETPAPTPAPKKKKRVSQGPPPETPTTVTVNSVPSIRPTPATPTSPKAMPAPPSTPAASAQSPIPATSGPTSPKPPSATTPVNPFTAAHRPKKSLSSSTTSNIATSSNPCRFTPPRLPDETFHGKVIVLTNGASQTGQALIRQFHAAGCRIIFGDTSSDQARRLISSLPPPHVVHFNRCDMTSYADMLDLFKLATTMYGRVDHAIFGVGDDGGQARSVGESERGWFDHDRPGVNKTFRMAVGEIEKEPLGLADTLTASIRFARIAMAYLKYSPKSKQKKKMPLNPYASLPRPEDDTWASTSPGKDDRSLTFVTSVAAFKETPGLPIYQVTQHGVLGLVRSLRSTVDPDPERDGVRINAVVTNVMVPRALAQTGGRMSVQLPPDRPEDVARVIAGVVATSNATSVSTTTSEGSEGGTGMTNGGGIWYEKGFERGVRERFLHGRVIYSVGAECWDVQEGLDRSESVWIGTKPAEALNKGIGGLSGGLGAGRIDGEGSSWILDLA
ncbi:hypothetical protein PV05_08627 [Exophiala xenobiotica]|uniref:Uncharacterized protein n=1 Tax=Exophiala xenobiotica TaxID=348802 RepID=A0A0D2EEI8_9EURO|nr:uncharacterized protein PV05_08627 [Exophiala xenobiotica]KIW53025.1 hypothetical protein PV05_08627 [Exophiala xenobiotica]